MEFFRIYIIIESFTFPFSWKIKIKVNITSSFPPFGMFISTRGDYRPEKCSSMI